MSSFLPRVYPNGTCTGYHSCSKQNSEISCDGFIPGYKRICICFKESKSKYNFVQTLKLNDFVISSQPNSFSLQLLLLPRTMTNLDGNNAQHPPSHAAGVIIFGSLFWESEPSTATWSTEHFEIA